MKKLFFAVAALFVASVSFAQGFGGGMGEFKPEDMAKRNVDRLKEQLNLNQAQSDSIYKVYLVQAQDMQKRFAAMQQGGGGQMQMPSEEEMQKQRQVRQAQEDKIKSFLTDDQKKQYDEIQAQRRQGGFGAPGMGGPRPQGQPGMGGPRPQGQPGMGQQQARPQQAAPTQQNGRQRNRR